MSKRLGKEENPAQLKKNLRILAYYTLHLATSTGQSRSLHKALRNMKTSLFCAFADIQVREEGIKYIFRISCYLKMAF
jgi:hypothetical protein